MPYNVKRVREYRMYIFNLKSGKYIYCFNFQRNFDFWEYVSLFTVKTKFNKLGNIKVHNFDWNVFTYFFLADDAF